MRKLQPPVVSCDELGGFKDVRVPGARGVVVQGCYPPSKVIVFHDNDAGTLAPIAIQSFGEVVFEGPSLQSILVIGLAIKASLLDVGAADGIQEEVVGEGDDIIIVGGTICVVWTMQESVGFVSGTRTVNERNVVIPKCENVARDPLINFLSAAKVLEIFVVGDYDHLVAGTHE